MFLRCNNTFLNIIIFIVLFTLIVFFSRQEPENAILVYSKKYILFSQESENYHPDLLHKNRVPEYSCVMTTKYPGNIMH